MTGRICGTGSCLPRLRVTNDDLSKYMDTSDEWIKSRTGIEARHLAVEETTTGMAVHAAKEAIEEAGVSPQELELIIGATVTPDYLFPYLSGEVQRELGAVNAVAFDVGAACSGFVFALGIAYAYLKSGLYKNALVLGAETLSKIMDWNDRSTCVLFGDGAGAAVLKADEQGIKSIVQGSDGAKGMVLSCRGRDRDNPFMPQRQEGFPLSYVQMNGQEVYKFAVKTVPACIEEALEEAGLKAEDVKLFVLHQANYRIIEAVAKRLNQPMEKFPTCLQECGNISAASVPILLDKINQDGKLKKGDTIVLAGFGAGLTWGACVLTW